MNQFDHIINRKNTNCIKYDFMEEYNKPEDAIPLWVADMDFEVPPEVTKAIHERAKHGVFGYTVPKQEYYDAAISWMEKRHHWKIEKDWFIYVPGVVFGIAMAIRALTKVNDSIMIQTPVYYPFYNVITSNDRKVVTSPLIYHKEGEVKYSIDFKQLERKIVEEDVKCFLLCNPHNPGGRVWTEEELRKLGDILVKHDVYIISDEIHMDFVYRNKKHFVFANLSREYAKRTITCTSPSKTFNLAGLQLANIIVSNEVLRSKLRLEIGKVSYDEPNIFGMVACQAAYQYGESWLDELLEYLEGNILFVKRFICENLPKIKVMEPEGTYLIWLDFSAYGLSQTALNDVLVNQAKVWLSDGRIFGTNGVGFQRINVATSRNRLEQALLQIKNALEQVEQE